MRRWVWAALGAVLAMGVLLRFLPPFRYALWGSDSGEYHVLIDRLVGTSAITTDYSGWGFGYPYFPGMFVLSGAVSLLCGTGVLQALIFTAPFTGALSVVIVFLLAHRAFGDVRAGVMAGAFVAACTPHVFATSHPMPGSVGDLLALTCLLLLFMSRERRAGLVALGLATPALVITHHLSTFFVLVPVLVMLLGRELLRRRTDWERTRVEAGYLLFLFCLTMLWWYWYAAPFRERVIAEGFGISPWAVLTLAGLALLAVPLLVRIRRRFLPGWSYRPTFPALKKVVATFALYVVGGIVLMTASTFIAVPGTGVNVDDSALLWFLPQVLLLGLGIVGIAWAEFGREGLAVLLWLGAVCGTFLLGVATSSHVLLPYRQLQFVMEVMALLVGAGAIYAHDHWNLDGSKLRSAGLASLLAAGVVLVGATSYPPRGMLGGFEEGIGQEGVDSVLWLREGEGGAELVATDHRMSTLAFGFAGLNASWDDAYYTLHGNLSQAASEIRGLGTPSGRHQVELVLVDEVMEEGVALTQWESALPLSEEALGKFSSGMFLKEYESGGVRIFRTDPGFPA